MIILLTVILGVFFYQLKREQMLFYIRGILLEGVGAF